MNRHLILITLFLTLMVLTLPAQVRSTQAAQKRLTEPAGVQSGLTMPIRRAPDRAPDLPPDLPAGAAQVSPLSLEVTVLRRPLKGPSMTLHQTIARSAERLHVSTEQREWLFERNPLDSRRVSATFVDHTSRVLVLYEESDLRNMLGFNGWANVLMLGIDPGLLAELKPSGHTRALSGLTFAQYSGKRQDGTEAEVWWNAAQLLPSHFALHDAQGVTEFSITELREGADEKLFEKPLLRLPNYKLFDLADWLEQGP